MNLPLNADGVLPLWGWPWLTASLIDTKVMQEKFVLHDTECFGKATMCAICGIIAFMIMIWQLVNGDTFELRVFTVVAFCAAWTGGGVL